MNKVNTDYERYYEFKGASCQIQEKEGLIGLQLTTVFGKPSKKWFRLEDLAKPVSEALQIAYKAGMREAQKEMRKALGF